MANDIGTPSAPTKAVEKSGGNVSGTQAVQMLVKRQAEAAPTAPSSEHAETASAKPETPTATIPEPSEETTKTPPPEEVAKGEPDKTEPDQTPPDEVLSQLSPEQRERIDRRIAKEVGKRKALEDEVSRLKVLAAATQQPPVQLPRAPVIETTPDNPLANITDIAELQKQHKQAEEAKDWAQEQLDREDVTEVKAGDRTLTRSDLKTIVRNSEKMISRFIPQRAQFIQERAQVDRRTAETFGAESWMSDRTSLGYQAYQQLLADPDIAKRPNASWIAAVMIQGQADIQRRHAANGTKAPAAPAKQKAPGSQTAQGAGFAPSREPSDSKASKDLAAAMDKLRSKKGVTGRDVEAYLQKMEQSRPTR